MIQKVERSIGILLEQDFKDINWGEKDAGKQSQDERFFPIKWLNTLQDVQSWLHDSPVRLDTIAQVLGPLERYIGKKGRDYGSPSRTAEGLSLQDIGIQFIELTPTGPVNRRRPVWYGTDLHCYVEER